MLLTTQPGQLVKLEQYNKLSGIQALPQAGMSKSLSDYGQTPKDISLWQTLSGSHNDPAKYHPEKSVYLTPESQQLYL